jgi:hypothetical protein
MTASGTLLANNLHEEPSEWISPWEDPDALPDVACVAGVLGLLAGLLAVVRLSGTHFPDTLFWRALPLLLVLPPGLFLGALLAPGGLLEGAEPGWSRAMRLGLGGLAGYMAPMIMLSLAAALACVR